MSFQALYSEANALYWKSFKRQNSSHLTLLKHQNTKTALHKLPNNHWVIALFKKIGFVRKKLLLTVSLAHTLSQAIGTLSPLPSRPCQVANAHPQCQTCASRDRRAIGWGVDTPSSSLHIISTYSYYFSSSLVGTTTCPGPAHVLVF